MKQFLKYGFGVIALYLLVYNGTNSGKLISAGATGAKQIINGFQGH
jgi:hypothetical protein